MLFKSSLLKSRCQDQGIMKLKEHPKVKNQLDETKAVFLLKLEDLLPSHLEVTNIMSLPLSITQAQELTIRIKVKKIRRNEKSSINDI